MTGLAVPVGELARCLRVQRGLWDDEENVAQP
jgi:hypothetical protein